MNNEKNITLKECIQVLSLFFILSIISVLMLYTEFEQGIENFWQDKEEHLDVFENEQFNDLIDLDNVEITEDVSEFDKKELASRYMESNGEVDVFNEIFTSKING
ncbi:MAG: hypothetical protein IJ039_00100 [Clostridia bacterium]|nr:hypothetical protein [Clostridia bacterium]